MYGLGYSRLLTEGGCSERSWREIIAKLVRKPERKRRLGVF
jgi:hypothetical protein